MEFAAKLHGGKPPKKFSYRGLQPLFEGSEFSVNANDTGAGMDLWTANSAGQPTMKDRDVVIPDPSFRGDAKLDTAVDHPSLAHCSLSPE